MRDGQTVATLKTAETNEQEIVRHMVGRDIADYYPDINPQKGKVLFPLMV